MEETTRSIPNAISRVAGKMVVSYKECLKNHAASLGGHALDGCGEFMPSPVANPTDPSSLRCAACGCHRNFHRLYNSDNHRSPPTTPLSPSLMNSVASPVPYSYYYSSPHVLLSLGAGLPGPTDHDNEADAHYPTAAVNGLRGTLIRKRTRTKFSPEQKVKMRAFAENVGWKINGCDETTVRGFCNEVGVDRGVLKVWMHNNKYPVTGKNKDKLSLDRHDLCLKSFISYSNGAGDGENGCDVRLNA